MLPYAGFKREILTIVRRAWPRSSLRSGSIRVAQSLSLSGLFFLLHTALALCADGSDDATEALGFHARAADSTSGANRCNYIDHPVFDKIAAVLRRETGEFDFHVQLRSCPSNEFFTHTRPSRTHGRIFFVDMPSARRFSTDTLSAVFAHELYHVFQYIRFGSFADIMAHYGHKLKSAELASDFGAGYLLSMANLPNIFEMNPELSGEFPRTHDDSHGTPAERSMAFRQGLYFTRRVSAAYSIENAEAYFREFGQR